MSSTGSFPARGAVMAAYDEPYKNFEKQIMYYKKNIIKKLDSML